MHTVDGRKRKTLYGKTRAEVAKKLTKVLSGRADGIIFDDRGLTVGGYLDRWLKDVHKVVSEMLGHSSISVTLDIYSHLLPDMQEKAAKALEEALK